MPTTADNAARVSALLAGLFPGCVIAAEFDGEIDVESLLPDEKQDVGKAALARVKDFAAGRVCARRALAELGITGFPLRAGEDRRPQWPESVVGSISHTRGYCCAVVAPRACLISIGVDVEVLGRVSSSVERAITTPDEAGWLESMNELDRPRFAAFLFSAKEAFYKCQYGVSGQWLGFKDVSLDFDRCDFPRGQFAIRLIKTVDVLTQGGFVLEGRFLFTDRYVMTGMAFEAAAT